MGYRSAYCSFTDVKRLLSVPDQKVNFSSSYRRLEWNTNNNGTIRLSGFLISDSYQGRERFEITFSDASNFTLMGSDRGYLGVGSIGLTFVSSDGAFTIVPSKWAGAAEIGDQVSWEAFSNMSNDNGILFMRDAMYRTNGILRPIYGNAENIPFYTEGVAIPHEVELANILMSACYIFRAAFAGVSFDEESPAEKWCSEAEKILESYTQESAGKDRAHWRSRKTLITEIGVSGVGEGVLDSTDIEDDKSYDR